MATQTETRIQASFLAAAEKRCLIWLAERLPGWVGSDHLTALGAVAMLAAGLAYWAARDHPTALFLVVLLLVVNWFGDSLDGTLARVRHQERPRYGFYVDHVLDVLGILFLFGGLAAGGFISPVMSAAFLAAYYLLSVEIALAAHTVGTFRISYWKVGPTELRILFAAGTLQLLRSPYVDLFGQRVLLFDLGAAIAIVALIATFVVSAVSNTAILYKREPLPPRRAGDREPSIFNRRAGILNEHAAAALVSATPAAGGTASAGLE
jgi:archaetidylinositol phosphate synthase